MALKPHELKAPPKIGVIGLTDPRVPLEARQGILARHDYLVKLASLGLDVVGRAELLESEEQVIARHSTPAYRIYTIGFAPGFCYLGGLDEALHTPRLESPRQKVVAGSVGIAGNQTGVYPLDSPGGWRLIGRTPLRLFAPEREQPLLYEAGDLIRFRPISEMEYHTLAEEDCQ